MKRNKQIDVKRALALAGTFNFLCCCARACLLPFLTLYFRQLGLTPTMTGIVMGTKHLILLVWSPAASQLSKHYDKRVRRKARRKDDTGREKRKPYEYLDFAYASDRYSSTRPDLTAQHCGDRAGNLRLHIERHTQTATTAYTTNTHTYSLKCLFVGAASKRFGIDEEREAVPLTLKVAYNKVAVSGRSQWTQTEMVCTSINLYKACRKPEQLDSRIESLQLTMTEVLKRQCSKSKKGYNQHISVSEAKVDKVQVNGGDDETTFAVCLDQDEKFIQSVTRYKSIIRHESGINLLILGYMLLLRFHLEVAF
ncbi:uncharacterized protein LOC118493235 [Sander lucioperca]|uniref:uncharacterized protein LOC118493235 n=1 Tax=Sander lucioperca TaxID=283035 RepID=UPI001653E075|nr:uncharacterized protein LOC118493235 [Sander lucioperca]